MASSTADSRFLVALAVVFGAVAALLGAVGVATSVAVLPVALVFAAVAALFYYHGSGQLQVRLRGSARRRRVDHTAARGDRRTRSRTSARRDSSLADAYRELDLEPDASMDAVRAAYREKTRTHHPDRGGDPDAFARINRAYERIRDADTD